MTASVSVRNSSYTQHRSVSIEEHTHSYGEEPSPDYLDVMTPEQRSPLKDDSHRLPTDSYGRISSAAMRNGVSPYLQKLPHSNYIQVIPPPSSAHEQRRRRRRSTSIARTRVEIAEASCRASAVDHLDLSSFFAHSNQGTSRAASAPIRTITSIKRKRSRRRVIHRHSSKSQSFMVAIYRNGDHNRCCYCRVTTLSALFQYATEKLQMPSAARRLFDANGREISRSEDIQANQDYYVSSGENFKDPLRAIQIQTEYGANSTWTMKGIKTDAIKPDSFKTAPVISDRLNKQIPINISLTIIENGFGHDDAVCHMIIGSVLKHKMETFLEECTKKLELTAHARRAFDYSGREITSLKVFLKSEMHTMQSAVIGLIYGPLWLSKGERFRPSGSYAFLQSRYKEYVIKLKKTRREYREVIFVIRIRNKSKESSAHQRESSLEKTEDDEPKIKETSSIKNKKILSLNTREITEYRETLKIQIKEIRRQMELYTQRMEELKDQRKDEEDAGASFAVEHIKRVDYNAKIVGLHPLCLVVHQNGSFSNSDPTIYLDIRRISRLKVDQTSIEYFLNYLQVAVEFYSRQRPKRVFDIDGKEIKTLGQLRDIRHVFISIGEDYRPAFEPCLAIKLHSVDVYAKKVEQEVELLLIKTIRMEDEAIGEGEKRSAKKLASEWKPVETVPADTTTIDYDELFDIQAKKREFGTDESRKIYVTELLATREFKPDEDREKIFEEELKKKKQQDEDARKLYIKQETEKKAQFDNKPMDERVSQQVTLIVNEKKRLMYPEVRIQQNANVGSRSSASANKSAGKKIFSELDLQTWFYDQDGFIYNKSLPSLVLTVVVNQTVQLTWTPDAKAEKTRKSETIRGFGVELKEKQATTTPEQIWIFTVNGYIVSKSKEKYALTSLATLAANKDEGFVAVGLRMKSDDPYVAFLGVCPKCKPDSAFIHRQRWGIRQESGFTIGDWRYSKVENPVWHKLALTWPVDSTGANIPDLQWPVEGFLIPGVPPIKALSSSQGKPIFVPIRLQVLKNGERDHTKSVAVVGPDISNLILETRAPNNLFRRLNIPVPEDEQRANRHIQRMANARQREIKLFMENCTELCELPFAARRLFDIVGTELFDLTSIKRDSYVYVTCGEQWIDPALTNAEQQRRLLLAYLSYDVRMIYFYCALRNPREYVVEAETGLCENSRLVLNKCALTSKQRKRVEGGESVEQVIENEDPVDTRATEPEPRSNDLDDQPEERRTAHERSHKITDQRAKEKFRWPWEKIANKSLNLDPEEDDDRSTSASFETSPDTWAPKAPAKVPKAGGVSMQQFRWESPGGYISCTYDMNLVFGVKEIEGKVVEVILKRRNPDDIFQRWLFISLDNQQNDGQQIDFLTPFLIVSKARPTMALTVLLPSCTGTETNEMKISCVGCTVTLQQRRYEENGCSNQKWLYHETLGFLFPFNATEIDKEITAANRANICSYTVTYEALSQPGFVVSILNASDQAEDVPVCLACAQAMRGKYRLVKIEPDKKFTCAIGKRRDLKFQGPFRCLNHKVDLTHNEAENTLFLRQEQLEQLRQEASVRNIARELAATKTIQVVHLLAHRNGDGHIKHGQLLTGSSINGLLDAATHRLNLTNAARRFYMVDGTVILTVEDLIQWITDHYKKRFNQLQRPAETKQNQLPLLDQVELNTPLPPKDVQRRSSVDNQSEKTTFTAKFRDLSPSKQRLQALPKSSDIKRAIKHSSTPGALDIDMAYLLKFPIEVWVSSGEPFVIPSVVDQRQNQRTIQREQRAVAEHDFELEKHTLQMIKGRRISSQATGELIAQQNSDEPVARQGHWTQPTDTELDQQDAVTQARTSVKEIRVTQQPESTQPISTPSIDRLTQHPQKKRVLIYASGEPKETAVQCFGSTLDELMADAKLKFNFMQPVVALFDEAGQLIERFDQLNRDQLVCASTTKTFVSVTEKRRGVEIKANWTRTQTQFGHQATDIRVTSTIGAVSHSVDPVGPPLLTLEDAQRQQAASKPPVPRYQRLAIEQPVVPVRAAPAAVISEVTASPSLMQQSLSSSDDDESNSEIERITNIEDDEVTSSRPMSSKRETRPRSPLSQLFSSGPVAAATPPARSTRAAPPPASKKSDSDDENDEFIAMLKRK